MEKLLAAVTNPWALIALIFLCIVWMRAEQSTDKASRRTLLRGFFGLAVLVVMSAFALLSHPEPAAGGAVTITGNSGSSHVEQNSHNTTHQGTMNGPGSSYNFGGGTTVIDTGNASGDGNNVSVHIGH